MRALELNVSTKFALMNLMLMLCLMYIVLKPQYLPALAKSPNAFDVQFFSYELSEINKYFVPLFSIVAIKSKFTPRTNSILSFCFRITSQSGCQCRETVIFVTFGREVAILSQL